MLVATIYQARWRALTLALCALLAPSGFAQADLSLALRTTPFYPSYTGTAVFTLTLKNDGPQAAQGVRVRDLLPAAFPYTSHFASTGTYAPATGFWDVAALAPGDSATLNVAVRVSEYGFFDRAAEVVAAATPDPDSTPGDGRGDDYAALTVETILTADLSLALSVNPVDVEVGQTTTLTVAVDNTGLIPAKKVVVCVAIPAGLAVTGGLASNGAYNPSTGRWTFARELDNDGLPETLTLTLRLDAEGHYALAAEVCDVPDERDIDSTPNNGDPGEDDYDSVTVNGTPSGGNDGGLESNGSLAAQVAQRLFQRRTLSLVEMPAFDRASLAGVSFDAHARGRSTSLTAFIPLDGPEGSRAVISTPTDVVGVTNATAVVSVDYVTTAGARLGVLFGTATPAGELYEHTKVTCDRLAGATLERVSRILIAGQPFVLTHLRHLDGSSDYAVSFAAYRAGTVYRVDSRFAPQEFDLPTGSDEVLNYQVWTASPRETEALVADVLAAMAAAGTVQYLNTAANPPVVPGVYVRSGRYLDGAFRLELANPSGATSARLTGSYTTREGGERLPFTATPALSGNRIQPVDVALGYAYDIEFAVTTDLAPGNDQAYFADAPWGYAADQAQVAAFGTVAQTTPPAPNAIPAERTAFFNGTVQTWASLFRYLNPQGRPLNVAQAQYLEFTASGTGTVQLVVEKANLPSFDQYRTTFTLSPTPRRVRVAFADLTRASGEAGFTGENVTLVAFYVLGPGAGQPAQPFALRVEDLVFAGGTVSTEDDGTLPTTPTLAAAYPNPFNPATTLAVALPTAMRASVAVYNVLGQRVATLLDGPLPAGTHAVRFDAAALPSGAYLVRLTTPQGTQTQRVTLVK